MIEEKVIICDVFKYKNAKTKCCICKADICVECNAKRAYKEFYGRPSFILRRLCRTKSWLELKNQIKGAGAIFGIGNKK